MRIGRLLSVLGSVAVAVVVGGVVTVGEARAGELSKVDRLLQANGFVLAANCYPDAPVDLARVRAANYSMVLWHWSSNLAAQGRAPGVMPWGRWAGSPEQMPPQGGEAPYMSSLQVLQLSDEPALEKPEVYATAVPWMRAAKANPAYADVILSTDLLGIGDATMGRYIREAGPDLVMNDLYPWRAQYVPAAAGGEPHRAGEPVGGPPTNWYAEMRRIRAHTVGSGTQFGMYRQTFHALQNWDQIAYRDPTPSELGLSAFAPMAFNAKALADFVFNGGASSFFEGGAMTKPKPLYGRLVRVNKAARVFGRALVRLTPLNDAQPGGEATTDILFVRGQYKDGDGATRYNPVPIGFAPNGGDNEAYTTQWTSYAAAVGQGKPELAVDPWLTGFQAKNVGPTAAGGATVNNGLKGDAIVAWFKPIGMTKAAAWAGKDVYYMVVNGLTSADPKSTAADCTQYINLDFTDAPADSIRYVDPASGEVKVLNRTTGSVPGWAPGGTYLLTTVSGKLRLSLFLEGGDAFLFKFNTGGAFVGAAAPAPVGRAETPARR